MSLKFGTDGIRGPVESVVTPDACLKIGHATGLTMKELGWDTVVIGKDTRLSGYMLEAALQAGFIAAGVNVRLLGPIPTPGVAYLTKTLRNKFGADNNISDVMLAEIFLAKYPMYSCKIKKPKNYTNKKSCGCC